MLSLCWCWVLLAWFFILLVRDSGSRGVMGVWRALGGSEALGSSGSITTAVCSTERLLERGEVRAAGNTSTKPSM